MSKHLNDKLEAISERLVQTQNDIKWIKKAIEGNGTDGILTRLAKLEQFKYKSYGALILLNALIGALLLLR